MSQKKEHCMCKEKQWTDTEYSINYINNYY